MLRTHSLPDAVLPRTGFIFISNPFLPGSQQYWMTQSLKVYPQKPNICNLDIHMPLAETENIWEKSAERIRWDMSFLPHSPRNWVSRGVAMV